MRLEGVGANPGQVELLDGRELVEHGLLDEVEGGTFGVQVGDPGATALVVIGTPEDLLAWADAVRDAVAELS